MLVKRVAARCDQNRSGGERRGADAELTGVGSAPAERTARRRRVGSHDGRRTRDRARLSGEECCWARWNRCRPAGEEGRGTRRAEVAGHWGDASSLRKEQGIGAFFAGALVRGRAGEGARHRPGVRPYVGGDPDASGKTKCSRDSPRWSCPARLWHCPDRWKGPRKCRSRHRARRAPACWRLAWCETG